MYCSTNFQTKKALKEAVKDGKKLTIFSPGIPSNEIPPMTQGFACVEGPHYPQPHKWYAEVKIVDGFIVGVK